MELTLRPAENQLLGSSCLLNWQVYVRGFVDLYVAPPLISKEEEKKRNQDGSKQNDQQPETR
ncbi:hypothetical protein ACLOJK_012736, partial [Asimina triloba]